MMPIGVPRVPYRAPQAGGWQWVDIWNCLVRSTPAEPQSLAQRSLAMQHMSVRFNGKGLTSTDL